MWKEITKNNKIRYVERYRDELDNVKRVSVTFDKDTSSNRKMASRILNDMIDERKHKVSDMTLYVLIERYLDYQKINVKTSTYKRNMGAFNVIKRLIGDVKLSKLSAPLVSTALYSHTPSTVVERYVRFKALIRWAYRNDYINDIRFLDKLQAPKNVERRDKLEDKYMERDELKKVLYLMDIDRWRDLTEFLALTGLRIGEALALEVSDVDVKSRIIHITKTYDYRNDLTTSPKTYDSIRNIDMQQQLYDLTKSIMSKRDNIKKEVGHKSDLLFCYADGSHVQYYAFNKYLRETTRRVLERPLTPHALRHTHVSLLAEQGVPLEVISRRLGHSDSKVTRDVYYHVTERQKEKDKQLLDKIKLI